MAVLQGIQTFEERWPLLAVLGLVVIGTSLVHFLNNQRLLSRIQVLAADRLDEKTRRSQFITQARDFYKEAYKTFGDGICRMTTTKRSSPWSELTVTIEQRLTRSLQSRKRSWFRPSTSPSFKNFRMTTLAS